MTGLSPAARSLAIEGVVLVAAVAALAAFAYGPRAARAQALVRDLALETAENETLGSRLAGQGDVAAEMRTLEEVAARFDAARLEPGLRGETSTRIRRAASRLGLAVAREGAWTGTPLDGTSSLGAVTLLRKDMTLRGSYRAAESFVAEIEAGPEGFVVEKLAVKRDRDDDGGSGGAVTADVRLLAVEARKSARAAEGKR